MWPFGEGGSVSDIGSRRSNLKLIEWRRTAKDRASAVRPRAEDPRDFGNPSGYCREDVDAPFQKASQTLDLETRRGIYLQLQEILAEELPNLIAMGTQGWGASDSQFDYSGVLQTYGGYSGWETVNRLP